MARRRYQEPKPKKQGRWWYLLYWQDEFVNGKRVRKRKRVKLAPAEMKEREVRKIAAEHLRPLNQALLTSGSATTFGTYVDQIYQPTIMPLLASSTQDRYARVLKNHLKPAFGDAPLRDVTLLSMQRYFAGLGRSDLSHESIDKLRDVLASVLRSAVEFGCLVKNPIAGLRLPPPRHRVRSSTAAGKRSRSRSTNVADESHRPALHDPKRRHRSSHHRLPRDSPPSHHRTHCRTKILAPATWHPSARTSPVQSRM